MHQKLLHDAAIIPAKFKEMRIRILIQSKPYSNSVEQAGNDARSDALNFLTQLQQQLAAWEGLVSKMESRLQTPKGAITPGHIGAMWQMCQHEAALCGQTEHVCSLFTEEVRFLSLPAWYSAAAPFMPFLLEWPLLPIAATPAMQLLLRY